MEKSIAFIGAGNMGSRMARRLLAAGHPMIVCDQNATVRATFDSLGARVTDKPGVCVGADIIIVMVYNAAQVTDVLLGPHGISAALGGSSSPIIVLMSTLLPNECTDLQSRLSRDRARIIDAPVGGGLYGAERGTLTIMVGGEPEDVGVAQPVLEILGQQIFHCGKLGAGQVAKIVNNMIAIANLFVGAEGFDLAARNGIPLSTLAPVLEACSGRNYFTEDIARTRGNYGAWSESSAVFSALTEIMEKDLAMAARLANEVGLTLPMSNAIAAGLPAISEHTRQQWQGLA
ncbi:MAG: 2-hydroxy-3-oxopropionate reductase (EC [uncultured Paraburkholderia sp.]|uniref:NAD(P)-dependent oxidoreductase n=1 Tax=uncultured Paraburkholderia sp. TaxID=1822466 RepID=UPI002593E42A|nr:NAD(P)-dependent oxidoreductase [uncultured Paraburkholderia sp.]CAH2894704.1 MAG: 2-hydroxy-3-oxopropionate reductase (EC [uncultured Paraburkholderia sp.]CAH2912840.1 MAG: 2-hydroxy-3-oxopropionate reductase (EC [uncultured Paraburkholderia sp.]